MTPAEILKEFFKDYRSDLVTNCFGYGNAVKKKLSKSKFFKLFQIEEELEDLENEDYIALLSQLAEEYEGFSEIECEDFIDLCDEYGITSEIEEDDFEEVKEKLEDMEIPELDDEWI